MSRLRRNVFYFPRMKVRGRRNRLRAPFLRFSRSAFDSYMEFLAFRDAVESVTSEFIAFRGALGLRRVDAETTRKIIDQTGENNV